MPSKILSLIWSWWKKIGLAIGNVVSGILLTVFYFLVFGVVSLFYKIFKKRQAVKTSNFQIKKSTISKLEEFKNEF